MIETYIVHTGFMDKDGDVSDKFLCGVEAGIEETEWDDPSDFLRWAELSPDENPKWWKGESEGRAICHHCYHSPSLPLALLADIET